MSKFSKKQGSTIPAISTASLPDIIFILLFFFMVVTVMKPNLLKVQVQMPQATELQKLEKKSLVHHIYIGQPLDARWGTAPLIQLNDAFQELEDIPHFVNSEISKLPEYLQPYATTSLRVDKEVTMGIVSDVKYELRKVNQLKINYSAVARVEDL